MFAAVFADVLVLYVVAAVAVLTAMTLWNAVLELPAAAAASPASVVVAA